MKDLARRTALACLGFAWTLGASQARPELELWTPQTSVAVRYFVTNFTSPGFLRDPSDDDVVARFSPHQRYFLLLSFRGILASNEVESELAIYRSDQVLDALRAGAAMAQPFRTLTMRSGHWSQFAQGIYNPAWEDDDTLSFVGTLGRDSRRLYRYEVGTDTLAPLTPAELRLADSGGRMYALNPDSLFFDTEAKVDRNEWRTRDLVELDNRIYRSYYDAGAHVFCCGDHLRWWVSYRGGPPRAFADPPFGYGAFGPWVSPDGRRAIVAYAIPHDQVQVAISDDAAADRMRYRMVDLATGTNELAIDAPAGPWQAQFNRSKEDPLGTPYQAFWSIDGRHALLLNSRLPQTGASAARQTVSHVVDLDVGTKAVTAVDIFPTGEHAPQVTRVVSVDPGRRVAVIAASGEGKQPRAQHYLYSGQRWIKGSSSKAPPVPAESPLPFAVRIQQDANSSQVVLASRENRTVALTPADPAMNGIRWSHVEPIEWIDSSQQKVESLLVLPPDHQPQSPVKLVVQLGDPFTPADAFRPDGEPGTAYAAQALAAQGFAVLQTPAAGYNKDWTAVPNISFTPNEGPAQVKRLDESVAMLQSRGMTPDGPIGLIGFSRSGYYVFYIATHPGRTRVGAAIVHDSVTASFGEYTVIATQSGRESAEHIALQYGGRPFWWSKEQWLDAPTFHLETLTTPMLFNSTNPLGAVDTIGALRLARRPFYYQVLPEAEHMLQLPRQRVAAMQSTLDWINFWLRGVAPADAQRLDRWRAIKADWEKVQQSGDVGAARKPD